VSVTVSPADEADSTFPVPSLILFDALDGLVHNDEKSIRDMLYLESGEIWFDGRAEAGSARKVQTKTVNKPCTDLKTEHDVKIEAVRIKDHALIRIIGKDKTHEITVALPDSTRYMYIGITGERCRIGGLDTFKADTECPDDYIQRIANEISYIDDCPVGDVPNVQVDGYRSAHSKGTPIKDGLMITFHAKTLPTARLVWHCPFIDVFSSDDGEVYGKNYRDLAFIRFDGECWECDPACHADPDVKHTDAFVSWDAWNEYNHTGYDASVTFRVKHNTITMITENCGISIAHKLVMTGVDKTIYAAVTGDQVAVTDIRYSYSS
ncbi:MAG: hypothetical protein IKR76_01125, partial [Ruminococcus sp.]|nr:hypothetical protein [Ruminococcus sp.]